MIESERKNFYKACFGEKKVRAQQLPDALANRKFSTAKQPDTAEMKPCRTVAHVKCQGEGRASNIRLADLTECCETSSCGLCYCLIISWLFLRLSKFSFRNRTHHVHGLSAGDLRTSYTFGNTAFYQD